MAKNKNIRKPKKGKPNGSLPMMEVAQELVAAKKKKNTY